jgi:hypothetical protein
LNARVATEVKAHCGSQSRQAVCLWNQLTDLEVLRAKVIQTLRTSAPDLKSLESVASQFMDASRQYQVLEGGGDAHLETVVSIRGKELYLEFASYLNRVANANPTLRNDLIQKVKESQASAQIYQQKCQVLSQKATSVNPAMKYCAAKTVPPLGSLMYWDNRLAANNSTRSDPSGEELENLKKSVFSSDTDPEPMLRLAVYHLQKGNLFHAVAIADYGTVIFKARESDFKGILGCGLLKLGFLTEASFHLKSASDYQNLRSGCVNTLQSMRSP